MTSIALDSPSLFHTRTDRGFFRVADQTQLHPSLHLSRVFRFCSQRPRKIPPSSFVVVQSDCVSMNASPAVLQSSLAPHTTLLSISLVSLPHPTCTNTSVVHPFSASSVPAAVDSSAHRRDIVSRHDGHFVVCHTADNELCTADDIRQTMTQRTANDHRRRVLHWTPRTGCVAGRRNGRRPEAPGRSVQH